MSFHHGLIPREGFYSDVVGVVLKRTLLDPTLMLAVVLLRRHTDIGKRLADGYPRAAAAASWLLLLGGLRKANNWLSRRAVNNAVWDHSWDWAREVVVVTGGSDGIGKHIVLMLASRDIKVAVLDVQPLTYNPPSTVRFYKCDITSTESIAQTAVEIRHTFGNPSVLINNAGICKGKPLLSNTDRDVDATFAVNTVSHYKLAREFLPSMIDRNHGMVVTIASSAAWVTAPRMTEYAASKAAAQSFHEGLAAELVATYNAPRVRTVLVNQGYVKTRLFQGFGVKQGTFLAPPLEVDSIAQAIVEQVLSGESGQVILPGSYKLFGTHFRSFPDWMAYPARAGMANLMANWSGRQVELPGRADKS